MLGFFWEGRQGSAGTCPRIRRAPPRTSLAPKTYKLDHYLPFTSTPSHSSPPFFSFFFFSFFFPGGENPCPGFPLFWSFVSVRLAKIKAQAAARVG